LRRAPLERPHQHRQRHVLRLPPVQNRLDDIGRQQSEPLQAAERTKSTIESAFSETFLRCE
jgi:hypothetical protein